VRELDPVEHSSPTPEGAREPKLPDCSLAITNGEGDSHGQHTCSKRVVAPPGSLEQVRNREGSTKGRSFDASLLQPRTENNASRQRSVHGLSASRQRSRRTGRGPYGGSRVSRQDGDRGQVEHR
jgi:hypothetical protein